MIGEHPLSNKDYSYDKSETLSAHYGIDET